MRRCLAVILGALTLTACGSGKTAVNQEIQVAVQQTIAAMPTEAPNPIPSPPAPATDVPLKGMFCEYQFCIGHPAGMAFFDVVAKQNPSSPTASTLDDGILAANNTSLFLEVMWQAAPSGSDGQFLLDLVIDSRVDSRSGDIQPILVRDLNVFYVPIGSTASAALPYGGAAAWVCDGRAFAWKAYAMQPDIAENPLMDALQVFRCE